MLSECSLDSDIAERESGRERKSMVVSLSDSTYAAPVVVGFPVGGDSTPDLLIVDWSNIVHRTFHGLGAKDDILSSDICLVAEQSIRSMTSGLLYSGWKMAIVLDGGYSGRKEIYGGYKGSRSESKDRPPQLVHALSGPTREQAQRITVVQVFGYEADDVMAALAHQHTGNSYMLSADRDLLQAVNDTTFLLCPKGPLDSPDVFTETEVQEKYG